MMTINLSYTRTGSGSPLVLIHGFPLDRTIWDKVIPLLEDRFDVIVPDLRGFGGSETVDEQYTLTDMGDDIAALLTDLGIDKAYLAGHSMGGYLALAFVKKHPKMVRGLALVSSQAAGDSPERKQGRYDTAAKVQEQGPGVVADGMAPKMTADEAIQQWAWELMSGQSVAGIAGGLKAMAEREDLREELANFDFPLVVIHGDADALIPIDMARKVADQLVKRGRVHRGLLGVSIQSIDKELAGRFKLPDERGALVGDVAPNGPAAEAGIKAGDAIVSLDGEPVDSPNTLRNRIAGCPPGTKVRLGLIPATIAPYVVEAIGPRAARALFASAIPFDALEAQRYGLVNEVVEDEAGLEAAMGRLSGLAFENAPGAVADAKALVRYVADHLSPMRGELTTETARRIAARRASDEGREGLSAFLERRKPSWNP